ncbi:MAG TPA: BON domain-containing protein [Magnetospirillaceae bacterium]|jgi:hyperosmotically inducible protein
MHKRSQILIFAAGLAVVSFIGVQATYAESAGAYIDDATITAKVKAKLVADQKLKAFDIHVTTNQGIVDLTGTVDSSVQKADAERIVKDTDGVKDIKDEIVTH